MSVVLAQAIIITFLGPLWWLQLILFVVVGLIRIKDIIEICKTFLSLFKKNKNIDDKTD